MDLDVQKALRKACVTHARTLLECAKAIEARSPHVAYHLATLALEEIGKSLLLAFPREEDDDASTPLVDNHLKKLFWALYSPFLHERIEKRQVEEAREFALRIHRTRLAGLYVEWKDGNLFDPKEMVDADQCRGMISMVEARLRMEENTELRELTPEDHELIGWFAQVSTDPEKRRYVFGHESLNKLAELKESKPWFLWLRGQLDSFDRESRDFVARELNRQRPTGDERSLPKWRVRIRLRSLSHSIRQKPLNEWNQRVDHIKLSRGDKKTLLADFTLPRNISLDQLWWVGWGYARAFATALNIATMGFFWFTVPEAISRYYDSIEDLESRKQVVVERVPRLAIDFGHMTLDSSTLMSTALVFAFLPRPDERSMHGPFDHYLTALAFMGKNDVHMQVEVNAFMEFFLAFRTACVQYGGWNGAGEFRESAKQILESLIPAENVGDNTTLGLLDLATEIERTRVPTKPVTLSEVIGMKLVSDAYFLSVFNQKARERARMEAGLSRER